jgi:hypothetical protein
MTDEAPLRITLQVALAGGTDRGKTAIAIVCEGSWLRCNSHEDFRNRSRTFSSSGPMTLLGPLQTTRIYYGEAHIEPRGAFAP